MRVRHSVFALIFCFGFTGYVQRSSVSIAAERMMPELGLSQVELGWLITSFLLAYAFFQVPGAVAGQRFGARRTLTAIGLATVGASLAAALAPSIARGSATASCSWSASSKISLLYLQTNSFCWVFILDLLYL